MAWRLAKSLTTLRSQVNAACPNRSKVSDGTIGDTSHAARASDHNPNSNGVVCALDLTHDPKNGFDAHRLAEILIVHRHPNLRYVISNRRIASPSSSWKWVNYSGSNPHTSHVHISVGEPNVSDGKSKSNYDSTQEWVIKGDDSMSLTVESVKTIYRHLLKREGDAGGVKNYTGKTLDFTLKDMTGSKEFRAVNTVNNTVVVEKPVEVIKEVVKEVVVEKPVEVIKEVVVEVEKPVPLSDLTIGQLFEALINKIMGRK